MFGFEPLGDRALGAIPQRVRLTVAGVGAAAFTGKAVVRGAFSMAGVAATALANRSTARTALSSAGVAAVSWGARSKFRGTFSSAGIGTVSFAGRSAFRGVFTMPGVGANAWAQRSLARVALVAAGVGTMTPTWRSTARTALMAAGVPTYDVEFVDGVTPSNITFTRTSTAYRINSSGLLESVSSGALRHTYDPVTLEYLGALLEETRANLALQSCDLTNAAWTKSSASAAKTATGPDGVSNSASTLTASGANGTALQSITSTSAARASGVWLKRRTGVGAISITQDGGSTWTVVAVTGTWTRFLLPTVTSANPSIGIKIATNADAVDVFNFQHELGEYASSDIPTTTVAVTRAADSALLNSVPFYNTAEGSLFVDFLPIGTRSGSDYLARFDDVIGDNVLAAQIIAGAVRGTVVSGNVTVAGMVGVPSTVTPGTRSRVAVGYRVNDFAFDHQGGSVVTDASGAVPVSVSRLRLFTSGAFAIRKVSYWDRRLGNGTLQGLATNGYAPGAAGSGVFSPSLRAQSRSSMSSAGVSGGSLLARTTIRTSVAMPGSSALAWTGKAALRMSFSSAGTGSAAFAQRSTARASMASAGVAAAAFSQRSTARGTLSAVGSATISPVLRAEARMAFHAAGVGTFAPILFVKGQFTISGVGTFDPVGTSPYQRMLLDTKVRLVYSVEFNPWVLSDRS